MTNGELLAKQSPSSERGVLGMERVTIGTTLHGVWSGTVVHLPCALACCPVCCPSLLPQNSNQLPRAAPLPLLPQSQPC